MSDSAGQVVDLGGCEGCGLGCAVACAGAPARATSEARRVLAATGLAVSSPTAVPAVLLGGWLGAATGLVAVLGLVVAVLGGLALRLRAPGADRLARAGYRLVPALVGAMVLAWVALVVRTLTA